MNRFALTHLARLVPATVRRAAIGAVMLSFCIGTTEAQSLDERLDHDRFLRGLGEYRLPDLLRRYAESRGGSDAAQPLLILVAVEEMALNAPGLSSAERLAAIERVLEARERLLGAHADDPRLAVWKTDQAADLYFRLFGLEALETIALFGLPSIEQRERTQRLARELEQLTDEAEEEILDAILDLEATPGYRQDIALQLRRRRLSDEERDRRIPFLRGIASFLHGEYVLDEPEARRRAFLLAVETLEPLVERLDGALLRRARLYLGLAHARVGAFDEAEAFFRALATDPDADVLDVFHARMGGVLNRAVQRGPAAGIEALGSVEQRYDQPTEVFQRLILADRRFLFRRELASAAPASERARLLTEAFNTYLALLDLKTELDPEALRALVFGKLASAADENTPLEQLPAIVTLARAENLAQQSETRAEAIALYEQALARGGLDERGVVIARFGLARAWYLARQPLDAARGFLAIARDHAASSQAERAAELAAAILVEAHRRSPGDEAVAAQLDETLRLILSRYPMLRDLERWRYELGRFEFGRGRFAEARAALEHIPSSAEVYADSRFMLGSIARGAALAAETPAARVQAWEEAAGVIQRMSRAIEPLRERATGERRRDLQTYLDALRVYEAEAILGQGRAGEAVDRLASLDPAAVDRSVAAELLAVRIRALHQAGRAEEARREAARFMASIPEQAGRVVPSMLDVLTAEIERLIDLGRESAALEKAREELLPLAQALEAWMRERSMAADMTESILTRIADAYRAAREFEPALRLYDEVLARQPRAREATLGRAESLFGLERFGEAMELFRRIAADRAEAMDHDFWLSELRLLQILDRVGRNTNQIRPRILRLGASDATYGGERFRRAFEILLNKYH